MKNILLVQGPNMRYLGRRLPELYGSCTASELDAMCRAHALDRRYELEILYSSSEGPIIDRIYDLLDGERLDGVVMNPASLIHNGHGLRACLKAIPAPYIEVHMTNIEERGMRSLLATEAIGVIAGFGTDSYLMALDQMCRVLAKTGESAIELGP